METWAYADLGAIVPGDPPVTVRYFDTHPHISSKECTTIIALHDTGWNARFGYRGARISSKTFGSWNPTDEGTKPPPGPPSGSVQEAVPRSHRSVWAQLSEAPPFRQVYC
ncbi:hypothetical protein CALCODRAFT_494633 [Calocera cornea HHB12733]|uniref:Uncharacterized protein n=1 Tax=Calocera cornea HHB12733 TaxID=1353952 RepID=A0A165H0R4_9BASI|nr:hypothetical protein CALCODRAFT_494633 [Calocera cornea HHB12733]